MKNYETVSADDIRAIHSRLDVNKQAIESLIETLIKCDVVYYRDIEDIEDMLEESQNPFEVSDGKID